MRTWRVGSFSMGAALVFLGVYLLLADLLKWDPARAMLSWWPVLFIVLGGEMLLYLFLHKEEGKVKYDFLSIFFIGVLGTFGLGMALLSATGLIDTANRVVSAEERMLNLPALSEKNLEGISRIVLDANHYPLQIEAVNEQELSLFGTYRSEGTKEKVMTDTDEYLLIERKGDTIYLKMKDLPQSRVFGNGGYNNLQATLLIPKNIKLDLKQGGELSILADKMDANWNVQTSGDVELDVSGAKNLSIQAKDIYDLGEGDWTDTKQVESEGTYSSKMILGEPSHTLAIEKANRVSVRR